MLHRHLSAKWPSCHVAMPVPPCLPHMITYYTCQVQLLECSLCI